MSPCFRILLFFTFLKVFLIVKSQNEESTTAWECPNGASESCNWRYFQHYEYKNCKPVIGENGCPDRFRCEELTEEDRTSCRHNGKAYKIGEEIKETGPCDICTCSISGDGFAAPNCAIVDCFPRPAKPDCYRKRSPTQCCPGKEVCPKKPEDRSICYFNGKEYKDGEDIDKGNECENCICTEDGEECADYKMLIGRFSPDIRAGCLPIYSSNGCYIRFMYCDGIRGPTPVTPETENRENYCQYQGNYYEKGAAFVPEYISSVSCNCLVPPDFTCR